MAMVWGGQVRFLAALVIAILMSGDGVAACPLNDTLKLCVLNGQSLAALQSGIDRGDWTVDKPSPIVNPTPEPRTGGGTYEMPNGLQFHFRFQEYRSLFSATCELNYFGVLADDRSADLRCSSAEFEAFEAGLSAASVGSVTTDRKESGTAYLIEGKNTWMKVVVVGKRNDLLNTWVETSVLTRP
ncbi:hypothetical protein GGE16_000875 [Rhizobium leguminosarum]|uniref:Uncharacterized protein n=1 Tax=Rhizobium leguminosarum TaxID=384 RepID=A0AAE2MGN0_RHILE|nr:MULTISPECIES: hypothetical protein [Rhizobium]MBB4288859.1 hypothetical protein [Rhizobium leguminosarum]MBB4295047.1 hypothetical protein [Rhizobium leguminosarum]MBB4306441.1 hypothetical protein [Rhizobium leguminosarum]MBB4417979.1 hypothetical protein [Rhizobium leguminosarum]MBB4432824.1 hypothetical protein [Rhizobium esperanzae]